MYEFLEQNAIYVVMLIVLMIWTGLFVYLFRIDRQLKELE
ncbi:MAG: CcmD family protein [Bacteroidetes bacterium]|nr:CcmD family protein [Bacteroidota bacterium]